MTLDPMLQEPTSVCIFAVVILCVVNYDKREVSGSLEASFFCPIKKGVEKPTPRLHPKKTVVKRPTKIL